MSEIDHTFTQEGLYEAAVGTSVFPSNMKCFPNRHEGHYSIEEQGGHLQTYSSASWNISISRGR